MDELENKKRHLLVILETEGGSIETTERIADVFRHHYPLGEVSFLIPNFAMSAGTILVMSGDRILMDYYSVLGPI
ncbi:SDH family Clp fold serine proteinase, partial [Umezakia ovalisporum]|uniref:SDH family Clp fold serine proteinase n=1 Tax=Umezakia ovalisporum TaxID=75695 RepID=UPI0039C66490